MRFPVFLAWVLPLLGGFSPVRAPDTTARPPARLTNIVNAYPNPSPDGERILFQSNRTGRFEIYVTDADGGNLSRLTDRPGDNCSPVWSPDGEEIVFAASPDGSSDIYLMKSDGSDVRRLTDHAGDDSHPHWSADGSRIIFNSARTTPDPGAEWSRQWHEVFSMRRDGTDVRQHTRCRAVCTYPSFSPDGRRIACRKIVNTPGFAWDLTSSARNSEVFVADADGSNEINLSNNAGTRIFAYQNQETADFEFGDVAVIEVPDSKDRY